MDVTDNLASSKPATKTWTAGTLTYSLPALVALFAWLLFGDFAWSMRDRSVGPMSQWYLNHLKVPSLLFALLVTSLPALIQLLVVPLISVKSDRHRGRWGRRIPFLLITTPMAVLGTIGLGFTPFFAAWLHEVCNSAPFGTWLHRSLDGIPFGAWVLSMIADEMVVSVICFSICWTSFEVATIAGKPVFDGLLNDVVPRPLLGRFYGLFRAVSLIDGMIFNYWIMGYVPTHFSIIMITVGLFYGMAFMWVCFKVKEGDYPPPPRNEGNGITASFFVEAKRYCRECFSHPYYLSVFVMMMAASLCFGPINIFCIPYAQHLGVDMKLYGQAVALTYLISLTLAYLLGWLADRFHPLRMAIGVLIGYALVTAWGWAYAHNAKTFLIAWVLHGVLSGCYFTSAASLSLRLFPHEKFAQFASAAGIFIAVSNIFMGPLLGSMIDRSHGAYRYTFAAAFLLTLIALVAACVVYPMFKKRGGPNSYVAPE
ncbi:MAG: MFS transporter [Verrucomicrobia bacterium Tous-C9LFEB]|nr:MAG: MFS transporter [Verrucomicrobia bacterium Tous-C9LFEB]